MARRRRNEEGSGPTGCCVIDKPVGCTSHDVVDQVRRALGTRRVGHAGTLDPDATGVLVVAVGMATRLLRFVGDSHKRYTGEVVLGTETDTLDAAGTVTATHDMSAVTIDRARAVVAEHLLGDIEQIPPMVSAIRVDGRRLHELAREGIEIERAPRPVTILRFDVAEGPEPGVLAIDVECTSGTYVRTLAADLGRLLGGGAHLRNLRRTAVGSFTLDEAGPPDECELLPVAAAVRSLATVAVDATTSDLIAHGRVLPRSTAGWEGDGPWAVHGPDGALLAVYESFRGDQVKPSVVLPSATSG
jgi:tRNA pseudouridine55 synthase